MKRIVIFLKRWHLIAHPYGKVTVMLTYDFHGWNACIQVLKKRVLYEKVPHIILFTIRNENSQLQFLWLSVYEQRIHNNPNMVVFVKVLIWNSRFGSDWFVEAVFASREQHKSRSDIERVLSATSRTTTPLTFYRTVQTVDFLVVI